jgi:hypothetical protein
MVNIFLGATSFYPSSKLPIYTTNMNYGVDLKNFFVVIYIPPLEAASFESTQRKNPTLNFKKREKIYFENVL